MVATKNTQKDGVFSFFSLASALSEEKCSFFSGGFSRVESLQI